jgi:hypothetical protein
LNEPHTLGYRIENGIAMIDESAAERIKILFQSYLTGDSLTTAAKKLASIPSMWYR